MGPRRTRNVRPGAANEGNSDLSRVEHQKELAEMLHERALERLREGDLQEEKKEKKKNPIAYRSEERFPRDKARELKILIGASFRAMWKRSLRIRVSHLARPRSCVSPLLSAPPLLIF